MITIYALLWNETMTGLEKEVNKALRVGWQLQGGVSLDRSRSGSWSYVQAMVKEEAESGKGKDK